MLIKYISLPVIEEIYHAYEEYFGFLTGAQIIRIINISI